MIVESKQPLIREIYAKLLETIVSKVLKAKDIQNTYLVSFEDRSLGCESQLHLSKYVVEKRFVDSLAESLTVGSASRSSIGQLSVLLQKLTLLKE